MKILALDPATNCGWAHSDGQSGTWDLSVRRDESSGMRLIRLRGKLNEIKAILGVDLIVFEASRNMQYGSAVRVAAEIQGVIKVWCEDSGVQFRAYSASEIKKHATGNGNAGKPKMMAAAAAKGWRPETDDEADALWALDLAKKEYA